MGTNKHHISVGLTGQEWNPVIEDLKVYFGIGSTNAIVKDRPKGIGFMNRDLHARVFYWGCAVFVIMWLSIISSFTLEQSREVKESMGFTFAMEFEISK